MLAKRSPHMAFTSLAHLLDREWMHEAFRRTRRDGAPGVDGQTVEEYERDLERNLDDLLERAKSGTYRAPPVRRAYIPRGKGKEPRPIGIPALEDKILQRAVVMLLEPIYEQEFLDCSHGFRRDRSAHGALESLWHQLMAQRGGWIVEFDIRKFFDELDRGRLREILQQRVRDGVVLRLIGKWLQAGVMEDGQVHYPEAGTPQGGVISPILANVYLHEVLDRWFEAEVRPRLYGQGFLIRYADDGVFGFTDRRDAQRVLVALHRRFERYGLALHQEKTRIVPFQQPGPGAQRGDQAAEGGPGSFSFLGFQHFWALSRRGRWIVRRKTAPDRLSRGLREIARWCRRHRHEPLEEQQRVLGRKLRGHYGYYGITGNSWSLAAFYHWAKRIWRKWLDRRGAKRRLTWEAFSRLLARYPLPRPITIHSRYCRAANP
jgi:group II intron reverse transcriptase/maturase